MNCLSSLELWGRGLNHTQSMHVSIARLIPFCVVLCVRRGLMTGWSPPSKESYRLCIGSRNWKSGQGPRKGCRAITIIILVWTGLIWLRTGAVVWLLWMRQWIFGFSRKGQKLLSSCYEGLCSMSFYSFLSCIFLFPLIYVYPLILPSILMDLMFRQVII
jgi:hypothetical protein